MSVIGGNGFNNKVAVLGGNGFIGHHIARRYRQAGWYVLVVDIKECEYGNDHATDITIGDLRDMSVVETAIRSVHLVIQMAADMGGCQYIFTGEHDADIMRNSAQINMNVLDAMVRLNPKAKVFYSSSACMYPQGKQSEAFGNVHASIRSKVYALSESDAYPADPDSEYGWEKLFSERLYLAYSRNYGIDVRIGRFHNIYGPEGTWKGGKEKAPASICRKVASASKHARPGGRGIDTMYVWGDGQQTRSFLYIDDCLDAVQLLIESDFKEPINIGSEESVSILELWETVRSIAKYAIRFEHKEMPKGFKGVHGRNSNNELIRQKLNWEPKHTLRQGLEKLFPWIQSQVDGI